ncbi:MAG: NlpC/P60 family protein [Roseibium sp.]
MMEAQSFVNAKVVEIARGWIGTPYHHQASLKLVGCDCLGLVRGIWREIHGEEPEALPAYSSDWGQVSKEETLINAAKRHLAPCDLDTITPGKVLVFRMRPKAIAKHCGVVSAPGRMIHALEGIGVCEMTLDAFWQRQAVACFGFR